MMLGWNIGVYRLMENEEGPATATSSYGTRLAVWQTALSGLNWIDELVKEGKAIDLGGNGYPFRYTATAEYLIPHFVNGVPEARERWSFEVTDIIMEGWEGKTAIDQTAIAACQPDEWLLVEAWDES